MDCRVEQLDRIEAKVDKIEEKLDNHLERIATVEERTRGQSKLLILIGSSIIGVICKILWPFMK